MNANKTLTLSTLTLTLAALVLWGCAGKPTRTRPGEPAAQAETTKQRKSVGLVVGGAGVASFATVGLLKKLKEEGIEVSYIVSTGWPSIFAAGYGLMKSIHDLEWFAMRLKESDFYSDGLFDFKKGYSDHSRIASRVEKSFRVNDLAQSRVPLYLTASHLDTGKTDVYHTGSWSGPLMKTISLPGIFRPFPERSANQWIFSLNGLDVDVAKKQGADIIVAVSMYDDYLNFVETGVKDTSENVFRQIFLTKFKADLQREFGEAHYNASVYLRKPPTDFGAKRAAIQAGYDEGARLARQLRSSMME
ncbi:MAG: hypothetical protein KDD51_11155 [Bdellovibrionales bacterium]|nr:hypothetical protein [Bdellovibrionales bacterium]